MGKTVHIIPGESAASSFRHALALAGRDDEYIVFIDDLSGGPIASDDPSVRINWWNEQFDWPEVQDNILTFWQNIVASEAKIVVWFGQFSARECAFRHAFAWHFRERPYYVVDVTGQRVPSHAGELTEPLKALAVVRPEGLASLLGSERAVSSQEELHYRSNWTRLLTENTPFRIVTPAGLVSAPLDYFDPMILDQAGSDWKQMAYVIAHVLGVSLAPYRQVSDLTLHQRALALVDSGQLLARGYPLNMRACHIKRA
ncbi:DUF3658 domain-containing protein [Advenella sp. S44]|uniref:DUF3658 domain-containing protein n=1 Tax=Advenella sp. S44 TaxID=1982755 RepID=UPI0013748416|nr:DUF3658 domain-containing protein [Advenella sp. S44]